MPKAADSPKGRSQGVRGDAGKRDEIKTEDKCPVLSGSDLQVSVCMHMHTAITAPDHDSCCWGNWSVCDRTFKVLAAIQGCPQMALKLPFFDTDSPQFRAFLVLLYALSPCSLPKPSCSAVSTSESFPDLHPPGQRHLRCPDSLDMCTCALRLLPLSPPFFPPSFLSLLLGPLTAVSVVALCLMSVICRHQMRANSKQE